MQTPIAGNWLSTVYLSAPRLISVRYLASQLRSSLDLRTLTLIAQLGRLVPDWQGS